MGSRCRSRIVFLSILVLLFHSLTQLSNAADRITKGQSIKDGETLTSSTAENFALGFFSPGNSTNRYVGIWFNKLSVTTVVWVANRENPISNSSGVLTIQSDGNLKVLDGNGKSLWSTNVSIVPGSNSTAVLMDTGNFLLCGEEIGVVDKALWQSFEDPTDTFLPGMRAGLNIKNGETKTSMYTSWKSSSDPAKGNFTMGVDPTGLAQIVIWENSKRHWRSGLWNGQIFIGVPGMRPRWLYGFQLSDLDGSKYFTYTVLSSSDILMFQIRWNGIEEQLRWNESAKNWSRFWIQPSNICQVYNTCGAYASCSMSSSPICTCIKGFEPKSMTDWNRGNWSGGCKRRTQLQCERNSTSAAAVKGDGFLELDAVKLPDHSVWKSDLGSTQCEDDCLKNCSCKAYAIVSGIGCLTWGGDLVDLQNFQQGGNKLFVRLANSELGKKKKIATWIIILCVILGIILLYTFAYLIWRKCKAKPKVLLGKGTKESTGIDTNKSREMWSDFSEQNDMGEGNNGSVPELPLLSLEVIVAATDNFSPANKLGQGGFGPVYKGRLPCGEEVAIKRLSRKSGQGAEEFKNEIILIAKLQHINLVRLLGCCIEAEEKILVYEYLPNKSLDAFIFDPNMNVQLDWQKRFNIIEGIARGILYLHRDSRLRIIHRDLKASNILLDEEMNPKISDFGMAKIFGGNQNEANTNRVVGTYGYMAPEYAMEGLFSVKSDVYSFGVLLLEILSGKKCTQYRHPESLLNLLGYFWKIWNEGKVMDFIDPCIKDSCSKGDVLRCVQVGLLCVQDLPMDRPLMSIVVLMLESETTVLPTPRQPNFTVGRTPLEMDLTIDSSEAMSRNDVTVTMVQGR